MPIVNPRGIYRSRGDLGMRHNGTYIAKRDNGILEPLRVLESVDLTSSSARLLVETMDARDTSEVDLCDNNIIIDRPYIGYGIATVQDNELISSRNIKVAQYYSNQPSRQIKRSLPRIGNLNRKYNGRLPYILRDLRLSSPRVTGGDEYQTVKWWFNDNYPSFDEAYDMVKNIRAVSYPFAKDLAVALTRQGALKILHKETVVGTIENDIPVLHSNYSFLHDRIGDRL